MKKSQQGHAKVKPHKKSGRQHMKPHGNMVEEEGSSTSVASKSETDTSSSKEISKGLDAEDENKKVEDIDVVRQVGLNNEGGE